MNLKAWGPTKQLAYVAEAQARGYRSVFVASNGAVSVACLESPDQPGPLYEFIEAAPLIFDGFAQGQQASRNCGGNSFPIRAIGLQSPG